MPLTSKNPTALEVVQSVLGQLALPVPQAAITAVGDETAQQMLRLLTWAGRRLVKPTRMHRWQQLMRTWQLTTVPNTTTYALPVDWDSFADLTGWNFTSRLPMLGPANGPQWQCLKARNLGGSTISMVYRTRAGLFEIFNSPSQPQDLRIDYSSRGWVQDAASPTEFRDYIDSDDDRVLYDSELITARVKLLFLLAKGFDTTAAQSEYDDAEEAAICADADAPVLTVGRGDTYPLISTQFNVPDTGYGG
jgi:hypothetical protein